MATPATVMAPLAAVKAFTALVIKGTSLPTIERTGPKATTSPARIPIAFLTPEDRLFHLSIMVLRPGIIFLVINSTSLFKTGSNA